MELLPELSDLIPALHGEVITVHGKSYFSPTSEVTHRSILQMEHGLVRIGFKVYELGRWVDSMKAYEVRWFRCNFNDNEWSTLLEGGDVEEV